MMPRRVTAYLAALSVTTLLAASGSFASGTVVFEDNFNAFKNGEHPSSILEVPGTPWQRGEVIDHRYAIHAGGNDHRLMMPKVRDFELTFTAEPHVRASYAPIMIITFRQSPGHGYRILHWFGPTWSRVDLHQWDTTVEPAIRERLDSTGAGRIALPQLRPIQWRLSAKEATFRLFRNGEPIWEYTDTNQPTLKPGAVSLDISLMTKNPTAPMFFDDIRVESEDPGIEEKFRRVYYFHQKVPGHFVAAHAKLFHKMEIEAMLDTGLDELQTGLPDGRMYRVTTSVDFPDMSEGKGRKMATKTPYIRLESTNGVPFLEQAVFDGVLGSTLPGHHSAAAQILRLLTEYESLPPEGVLLRTAREADASGPQKSVAYLAELPKTFQVTAGWEYWLDNDHIHVAGPVEATWNHAGEPLYAGRPIEQGQLTFTPVSPVSQGILSRIRRENRYYDDLVRFQEYNHYFLEGETVAFTLQCGAGVDALLNPTAEWQLLDCYLREMPQRGTVPLAPPESSLWPRADRKLTWESKPFGPDLPEPGVYWLQVTVGQQTQTCAFSIVPGEQRPGNTAAAASGLPALHGNFYPMQPWNKDIHHYVSGAGGSRNDDWYEAVHAYNMLAIERGRQPLEVIRKVEGVWNPGLTGVELPSFPKLPHHRLWRQQAVHPQTVKDFLASDFYQPQPGDDVLRDPEATKEACWQVLMRQHLKPWAEFWSEVRAKRDIAERKAINEINPDLITSSYGPLLISSYQYGNLYCGKYYGWDWKRRVGKPHLINTWQVETYAREFGRASMTYTPSLALTKMSLPEVNCKWELYGSVGGVEDSRMAIGRPPHGLSVPNRDGVANHCTELSLAPWYFDGAFKPGSGTHLAPWVGHFTQEQVFGLVDGIRMTHEAQAVRPVRSPAFVRSYEAAELDPSWEERSINNSAAEAPAYAYVQARMAGLAGGFFVDIDTVAELEPTDTDLLVLPSMRGATADQVAAIRDLYAHGVALLCFDDCSGLEDIFAVRRLADGRPMTGVALGDTEDIHAAMPAFARRERVRHRDTLTYETEGAREILVGIDDDDARVAPLMTIHAPEDRPAAVFYALGATRVGRREKPLNDTNHEGEVISDLIRHALRAAMRRVSNPVVTVEGPASVLAFVQPDGDLYVVLMEASFPLPRPGGRPADVTLTIHTPSPNTVSFDSKKPLLPAPSPEGTRRVKCSLATDEVVPIVIQGAAPANDR